MKELTKQQICDILNSRLDTAIWHPDGVVIWLENAFNDAYRLGQQHGIEPLRFQAACAAMQGYRSRQTHLTPEEVAEASLLDADALIAELNRTAEKGGEG